MGAKCCAESKQAGVPTEVPAEVKDLPAVDVSGIRDPYEKFERSLPFSRTLLPLFIKQVEEAEKACGDEGYVTLQALRNELKTGAWKDLENPASKLGKTLLSKAFKDEKKGTKDDQIDAEMLKLYGLLNCSGKPIDKTNAFYCILQEGGFERHEQISAGDKDFEPVFTKICEFVSKDVMDLASRLDGAAHVYTEDEIQKLVHEDTVVILREDQWLEEVFGANSRLQNAAWVQQVSTTANWIFDAKKIRQKLFTAAEVTAKH